jgi:uncharacterized protein YbcI
MGTESTLSDDPDLGDQRAGSRALQISNAIGRVHKEFVGRGPTAVRTHLVDDLVVCVLEGGLTQAERTVWEHAGEPTVREMRSRLQHAMKQEIVRTVEAIVGRPVLSFMSASDPEHNLQAEVMVLG